MVFLDVAVLGLIAGKLLGGRLSGLGEIRIRAKWLAFVAIAIQLVAFPLDFLPWATPSGVASALWLGSYVLLVAMLIANVRLPGTQLIAAGLVSNVVAIVANGGLMPVRASALQAAGTEYGVHNNSIQLAEPRLAPLIDRWAAPDWLPLANVYSVGDVLIGVGLFVVIVVAMRVPPGRTPSPTGVVVEAAPGASNAKG